MTPCSPTPSWPTRSPASKPAGAGAIRHAAALAAAVVAALAALADTALAHELEADGLPEQPGWKLGAGLSLSAASADTAWPTPRYAGVLLTGQTARDRRKELALDQATVAAGVKVNRWLGAEVVASAHDQDAAHLDTARLDARATLWGGQAWARLGRQSLRMSGGGESANGGLDDSGGLGSFVQAPLARQAAVNQSWSDDGLTLGWQQEEHRGLQAVELGVWRGQSFPGSAQANWFPSLRLTGLWDDWRGQLFGAWLRPQGRGALALASATSGHTHSVPDCATSTQNLVCLDGHSQVLGASLNYEAEPFGPSGGMLNLSLSALGRWESGSLYNTAASARYRGHSQGWWLDANYQFKPTWQVAGRVERLVSQHRLEGANVSQVASAAGLLDARPVARLSAALGWQPASTGRLAPLSLWLEAGSEQTEGMKAQPWVLLRMRWLAPGWLQGQW